MLSPDGRGTELSPLSTNHSYFICSFIVLVLYFFYLQAIVFFDGMRDFYEQELKEVNDELNFAYESWSSSLVTS